jgi:hypothetical protein
VEVDAFGVPLARRSMVSRLFHKRPSGPQASPRFHHKPDPADRRKLEAQHHNSEKAIGAIVDLAVTVIPSQKLDYSAYEF